MASHKLDTSAPAPPAPSLMQLNQILHDLQQADTPSRLIRHATNVISRHTGLIVTGFARNLSSADADNLVDEHLLPAEHRGGAQYPRLAKDHTDTYQGWTDTASVTKLCATLDVPEAKLHSLILRHEVLGGIVVWGTAPTDPDLISALEFILRECTSLLYGLQLSQAAKSSLAETMALQRINQAVTRSLDFDKVASTLLRHAHKLFRVEAIALALATPSKDEFYVDQAIGLSEEYLANIRLTTKSELAQQLIQDAKPLQIYDLSDAPFSGRPDLTRKEGLKSMLLAPIFSSGEPVGALALLSKTPRRFLDSEVRFSQSLAEQAGIAFANATLHTNLLKVTNEIEQTRNLMRDGLVVLGLDKRLRYFNAAAGTLLGLTSNSLMLPLDEALAEAPVDLDTSALDHAIAEAQEGRLGRTTFATTESEVRHFEAIYSPYRDNHSKLIGLLISIRDITSLYLEKEKLQTIQTNIQDGILMIDADGVALEYNKEWQRLFDLEADLTGQPFFELLASRDDISCDHDPRELIADVLRGKRIMCYAHFPGQNRHIQISLGAIKLGDHVTGAVATARDITPLIEKTVEANEMAAKAQRHLRELSQLAELSGIVGFNVANIYQKYLTKIATLLSSSSVSIYLYDHTRQQLVRQQTINPRPHDLVAIPLDSEHPAAQAFAIRRGITGDPDDTQPQLAMPIIHHSKTLGVLLVGRPEHAYSEHDAKLMRLVATRLAVLVENAGLYHDVNARRERWEAVFRFTEEGIVIFDRDGTIVGFNPASTEITQHHAAEAIGQPFSAIIKTVGPDPTSASLTPPLQRVLSEGVTIAKSEHIIESRNGNRIWTEISYSPIFDDTGRVTSGIAIIRNTSKDREVEEIKSDFISIVSHELRTPLTAIKGFLSMTLKGDFGQLAEKQYHYLSRVYQSNQRMIDLVEDLMDATYIESGKINLTISPVAIESIISEVVSELAGKGAANQIMINVRRRQRLPLVLADETRLHQIILNLVDNAIKYSMPGTEVEVDFKVDGDELITIVTDHGVGITKNQIDRLFTKFGRIFNPLSVQAGGTGLGLYIVKNLVESHGGRIWVTSQENRGSKFRFSLPIAKQLPLLE